MKEMDFKVVVDLSGLSIAESVMEKGGPMDRNSIKKRIDSDGTPRYTFKMTGTTIDKVSVNGLKLNEIELDNMVAGPFVQKRLKNNALYCEMNHPASKDPLVLRSVNLNNLSHRILEFFKEQQGEHKALCFIMETTRQQAGKILAYMVEDDAGIAVSLRAHASAMRVNGEIMKNIHYTSYDAVWIPSNEASWGSLPSKLNMQITESINTDLAHAMGADVEGITKFKMNSILHLEELNKKNIKRIDLLESYLLNGGDGCKIIDLGSKGKSSIQESIMNISESAGIDFGTGEHDYVIINESIGTAIFANGTITAEAKLAKSMISDIMQNTKKKLFL